MTRLNSSEIESKKLDAIIIGAGINGAGIARDAAMRGLNVLLLDKGDIASGTSSWSTRLIHGGLRYLEYGELHLVRESLREREILLRLAPHLVKPLPLIIPIYTNSRRGIWAIRAGMMAYDLLSFDKSLPPYQSLSRSEVIKRLPGIKTKDLRGGVIYYDAQVEYAERLVLENVLSAHDHGALIFTYAQVDQILINNGITKGVVVTDSINNCTYKLFSPVVVNVAGPWVDKVLSGTRHSFERFIGGTKGSHIIVGAFPGAPTDAIYVESYQDQRPFFIIPWNNKYLIGTTDSRYEEDLDRVQANQQEINYLLNEVNHFIPTAKLTADSILYTYSGVRPLPCQKEKDEKSITRKHFIHAHEISGLISIVGGKLTTYRSLSESAVDRIFKILNKPSPTCKTSTVPLPGAQTKDFTTLRETFKENNLSELTASHLLKVYGTRAQKVLKITEQHPELKNIIDAETGAIGAEILMALRYEMGQTLADCLFRRTMIGLGKSLGLNVVESATGIAQKYFGWDEEKAKQEIINYQEYIKRFCSPL
jgi:glycerol-3-phosphate dehydrogenase